MRPQGCEFLIIGAGILGLTIARELVRRGAKDVVILEKEQTVGQHASGRNSGVLHAGIYYTPETHKARFCVEGNRRMKDFCRQRNLDLHETGKVIVATHEDELPRLDELHRRAQASGAQADLISPDELREIEPYARTVKRALYTPDTALVDPQQVLTALRSGLEASGRVAFQMGTEFLALEDEGHARCSHGRIRFEQCVNVAGAYADRVAHQFGLGQDYLSLPFKGTYMTLTEERNHWVNGNIYPVPDLRNPFLGVHLSRNADGQVYVGPTAIPAFGRENYGITRGLGRESLSILYRDALMFARNSGFRTAAVREMRKYVPRYIYREAKKLVPALERADVLTSAKVGIRPQLVHWPTKQLVGDYVIERDDRSLHLLNAISPAFTSSMAFAPYVVSMLTNPDAEPSGSPSNQVVYRPTIGDGDAHAETGHQP